MIVAKKGRIKHGEGRKILLGLCILAFTITKIAHLLSLQIYLIRIES